MLSRINYNLKKMEKFMTALTATKLQTKLPEADEFGDFAERIGNQRPDYSVSDPLGPISGFTNYNVQEMRTFSDMLQKIADVYRLYGFTGIITPPFEYAENLLKKGGLKEIYGVSRLQTGLVTKLGVPFDRTVPTAIFVARNRQNLTLPYKRFSNEYSCRGENATKGRYRAFYQCDADIFDKELTAGADAETITAMVKALEAIGVNHCNVFLNHVQIAKAFVADAGIDKKRMDDALRIIDKLKPHNWDEVVEELSTLTPDNSKAAAEELLNNMNYRGLISEYRFKKPLGSEVDTAFKHLQEIESTCVSMGVRKGTIQFCTSLTRGLDYYTGVVFESFIPGKEKYGSIASGGRYDDLVDGFADAKIQGVGGSIGLTRLFDVLKDENQVDLSKQTSAQVFVGYRTKAEGCYEKALEVATALRDKGISVELYTASKVQVGKELDICNKKGIPCSVMVMRADELQIAEMRSGQKTSFGQVASIVDQILALKEQGFFQDKVPARKAMDDSKS